MYGKALSKTMRVKSIWLKNFKRFTNLKIDNIPETARLVVVIGPNGCGKSSLFDAFIQWQRGVGNGGFDTDEPYFLKSTAESIGWSWHNMVEVVLHGNEVGKKGSLYVRSAYRNESTFDVRGLTKPDDPTEWIRLPKTILNDQTVGENYMRLIYATVAGTYDAANDTKTVKAFREEIIGEIQRSMTAVFGDLVLSDIADPFADGSFRFQKGAAGEYHYMNLSGGEKAAFDLLLDIIVKRKFYKKSLYCIDEMETHLHTKVQGKLLAEIFKVVPDQCQLWLTTHSLGVLRAVQSIEAAAPGSVAVIDFDGVNADEPQELRPSNLGRVAWGKMLSVALDDLIDRLIPEKIIVCEGSKIGNRRKDFDAEVLETIFEKSCPTVQFISGGSGTQVQASAMTTADAARGIARGAKVIPLMDRDNRSAREVRELEAQAVILLGERNLESYLLADDILTKLCEVSNRSDAVADVLQLKRIAVESSVSRGNATDDLKSAAGEIYTGIRKMLQLTSLGNSSDAFLRDTLSPLITKETATFQSLKAATIDRF